VLSLRAPKRFRIIVPPSRPRFGSTTSADAADVYFSICLFSPAIMMTYPPCPACGSTLTYEDGSGNYVCPECAHEWPVQAEAAAVEAARVWRDAAGNVLQDGDTVTVIKDLKLKGGGGVVKQGTKVKNIRLVEGDHDIDCKIDGFGAMSLKSEFVRKS
jgi:protein PhnA